ncbi:hypothetical protein DC522_17640 [Microvirga sp. KLBC 81]|uniref:hypothetical protein n=1 Tax=Microvirga sp. KLBC 81 TaxID=1862707 RepID=UPI000D512211|nr:hypothetical protein [Microvirga sp. KLBC 81]PVE23043.1 hypothetical protein DC522_17640 [Microvirga sp. KLBC 81]
MYIWKLAPIMDVEGGVESMVVKAQRAKLSSIWVKVANGNTAYSNATGAMAREFARLVDGMHGAGIQVWGWHVPRVLQPAHATDEAELVASLASTFHLDGALIDAEAGSSFFQGTPADASIYASRLRQLMADQGKAVALSSHDIPTNFPEFPFWSFAQHVDVNAPQVYYGASSSVKNRLDRAVDANADLQIPMVPVGAGWVGPGGGCASANDCAERALAFMMLCRRYDLPGYSFWHWYGAPTALWDVLFNTGVVPEV